MSKKNSKGAWKERYCILTSDTFVGLKTKSSSKDVSDESKENFDLKLVKDVNMVSFGNMEISLMNGKSFMFQSDNDTLMKWTNAIEKIINVPISKLVYYNDNPNKIYLRGFLSKKSNNKFQTSLQVRYSHPFINSCLHYLTFYIILNYFILY